MKLIIIHGPPATGKLTVAREIEKLTGIKVFHNHLSNDCVTPIFEFGSKPFDRLVEKIRLEMFAEAVRENVDLIFTVCYGKGVDDILMNRLIESVELAGGDVCNVLLFCQEAELKARVGNESRGEFHKIRTVETLQKVLLDYDFFSPVSGRETLIVDNTSMSAENAAKLVIERYGLDE